MNGVVDLLELMQRLNKGPVRWHDQSSVLASLTAPFFTCGQYSIC